MFYFTTLQLALLQYIVEKGRQAMTDFNNFNYREINATQSNFIGFVSNGKIYNSFNQQIGVTNEEYKKP